MKKASIFLLFFIVTFAVNLKNSQCVFASDIIDVFHDAGLTDVTRERTIPLDGIPDIVYDNILEIGKEKYFSFYREESLYSLWESRSIMTFDISPYAGRTLTSAVWTGYGLNYDIANPQPHQGKLFLSSGDGFVTPSDFNSPAVFIGEAQFPSYIIGFDYKPIQLDVTAALQDLVTLGSHYAELRIESDLNWAEFPDFERNNEPYQFLQWGYNMNLEAGEAAPGVFFKPKWPGPQLTITTTPEPVSSALFLIGGGAMFYRRFQKRK
ncbi:MAG: PEP-CTERM sorting domain-containing protein [Candidatus Omnitrophica bacterium]|nr:PEP-CTERM sorting domain-containing protein [Candidatus Omnitrophota bacterium]